MYVESVTMTDFRCFEKAKGTFVSPGKEGLPEDALDNVTLLMGINGAGKTSTLRGVALALLSPIIGQSGLYPRYLVRRASPDTRDPIVEAKIACIINDDVEYPNKEMRLPSADKSSASLLIRNIQDTGDETRHDVSEVAIYHYQPQSTRRHSSLAPFMRRISVWSKTTRSTSTRIAFTG